VTNRRKIRRFVEPRERAREKYSGSSHSCPFERRTYMTRTFAIVAAACSMFACHENRAVDHVSSDPAAAPIVTSSIDRADAAAPIAAVSSSTPAPLPFPTIEHAEVAKDSPTYFIRGENPAQARVVFMPGLCSNAAAYLTAFPIAARDHGGIVAIDGDKPCGAKDSGFHSFTWSADMQHARIEKALAAAGQSPPPDGYTLVGYSAGASIAEMVHQKWPDLFPRLLLIAPPEDLWIDKLMKAKAVVSMSCSRDVPGRMKDGAKKLGAKGVRSIYMEMPKCTHGNITEGERIFGEAFAWLDDGETSEIGD
jgi:hypothetical protein